MKKAVSHRCVDPGQRIREKHKMRCISAFFLAVGMALLLFVCAGVWQGKNYLLAGDSYAAFFVRCGCVEL